MNFCFIVSLMALLSLTQSKTVITVDGNKSDDAMCSSSLYCKTLDAALSVSC